MPSFSSPLWLLLLPAGYYLFWRIQRGTFADAGPALLRMWLGIRILLFTLIVLALAGLSLRAPADRKQVVFLVDVSQSITADQKELAIRWLNSAMSRLRPTDRAGIVVFGADAAVERFPAAPRPVEKLESRVDPSATNMENAARLASALFAADCAKNLVVISDGNENEGSAAGYFKALQREGVTVQALQLPESRQVEAALESVRLPPAVSLKERFELEVVASSNVENGGLIEVRRNGVLIQQGSVKMRAGERTVLRLPQEIDQPGTYRFRVELKPDRDSRIENNSGEAWVTATGRPVILLVDSNIADMDHLAGALKNRGFEVAVRSAGEFPLDLQEMLLYRAIWIRNVPASRIQRQMPALKQYVHDFGGGFAMLGGEQSFGPGGYFRTPVEEMLPVNMNLTSDEFLPEVAMVIVIDKSGSMSYTENGRQKIDLADEGASRVAMMLKGKDQLGVLAVDSVPKWVQPLEPIRRQAQAIESILSIRAGGGGIYVFSGLNEAYRALSGARASVKHVILFADTADCEEKDGPGGSSIVLARRALEQQKITTTAIGIGKKGDVDIDFLKNVTLAGKGRFYFTDDMYTLPEIFSQESAVVQRNYIYDKRFTPSLSTPSDVTQGIAPVPDLMAYVGTSLKRQATAPLVSPRREPVLALWPYGIGRSAAFTSGPDAAWASPWLAWPEYDRFWSQLARYLAATPAPAGFRLAVSPGSNTTKIILEAVDDSGVFVDNATYEAVLAAPEGPGMRAPFAQAGPGRYEATVPSRDGWFGKVFRVENGQATEEAFVQLPPRVNRELQPPEMQAVSREALGGILRESPDQLVFPSRVTLVTRPVRNDLLAWIALLFLLDVALRKLDFRRRAGRPAEKWAPASTPTLSALKDRKRSVNQALPAPVPAGPIRPAQLGAGNVNGIEKADSTSVMERLKKVKRRNV